jgi:hypothetical protein
MPRPRVRSTTLAARDAARRVADPVNVHGQRTSAVVSAARIDITAAIVVPRTPTDRISLIDHRRRTRRVAHSARDPRWPIGCGTRISTHGVPDPLSRLVHPARTGPSVSRAVARCDVRSSPACGPDEAPRVPGARNPHRPGDDDQPAIQALNAQLLSQRRSRPVESGGDRSWRWQSAEDQCSTGGAGPAGSSRCSACRWFSRTGWRGRRERTAGRLRGDDRGQLGSRLPCR